MTRVIVAVVVAVAIFSLARADAPLTTYTQMCQQIGDMSGCSGCNQGTKGLCRFISRDYGDLTNHFYSYYCVPSRTNDPWSNIAGPLKQRVKDGSHLCPVNPLKEPIWRHWFFDGLGKRAALPPRQSSTVQSKTVQSQSVSVKPTRTGTKVSTQQRPVDRTASTQPMGKVNQPGYDTKRSSFAILLGSTGSNTCEKFVSPTFLFKNNLANCRGIVSNVKITPNKAEQDCLSLLYAVWGSYFCPEYGVAYNGFCESFAEQVERTCGKANCAPLYPWNAFDPGYPIVVNDKSLYCINKPTVKMAGQFEELAGYDEISKPINSFHAEVSWYSQDAGISLSSITKVLNQVAPLRSFLFDSSIVCFTGPRAPDGELPCKPAIAVPGQHEWISESKEQFIVELNGKIGPLSPFTFPRRELVVFGAQAWEISFLKNSFVGTLPGTVVPLPYDELWATGNTFLDIKIRWWSKIPTTDFLQIYDCPSSSGLPKRNVDESAAPPPPTIDLHKCKALDGNPEI